MLEDFEDQRLGFPVPAEEEARAGLGVQQLGRPSIHLGHLLVDAQGVAHGRAALAQRNLCLDHLKGGLFAVHPAQPLHPPIGKIKAADGAEVADEEELSMHVSLSPPPERRTPLPF